MKTALVNFEMFFVPEEQQYDLIKKEIGDSTTVVGLMLADGFLHNNPGQLVEQLSKEVDLYIIPGMAHEHSQYDKIIPFNFNLHTTYQTYKDKNTNAWNSKSSKFLFLGGVPNRPNRIGLLNKFYKAGLMDQAEWSFFKPWTEEQENWCRSYIPNYEELLTLCRCIDNLYDLSKDYGTDPFNSTAEWTKNTSWIDPSTFNQTVFSVVSEGVGSTDLTTRYLTEKTYRVFVQRHPFIIAGTPAMFSYIKELGFKTFEEYMSIPHYGYINNEDQRLDAIVENTQYFLNNYHKNIDDINQDIEHNYKRFFELAGKNNTTLLYLQKQFNISQQEIDKWFNQKGFGHLVRAYD
jgi:hypothetical protein